MHPGGRGNEGRLAGLGDDTLILRGRRKGWLRHLLRVFAGIQRVLSLDMVPWGKYKGNL